jgi:hypothetical protein
MFKLFKKIKGALVCWGLVEDPERAYFRRTLGTYYGHMVGHSHVPCDYYEKIAQQTSDKVRGRHVLYSESGLVLLWPNAKKNIYELDCFIPYRSMQSEDGLSLDIHLSAKRNGIVLFAWEDDFIRDLIGSVLTLMIIPKSS